MKKCAKKPNCSPCFHREHSFTSPIQPASQPREIHAACRPSVGSSQLRASARRTRYSLIFIRPQGLTQKGRSQAAVFDAFQKRRGVSCVTTSIIVNINGNDIVTILYSRFSESSTRYAASIPRAFFIAVTGPPPNSTEI